jgi:hypothetical protein
MDNADPALRTLNENERFVIRDCYQERLINHANQKPAYPLPLSELNFQPRVLRERDFMSPCDPGIENDLADLVISEP